MNKTRGSIHSCPKRASQRAWPGAILIVLLISFSWAAIGGYTPLPSWNDGDAKKIILEFVEGVIDPSGTNYIRPAERIAVFDNDGTLCIEKPTYIEIIFALNVGRDELPDHPEWEDDPSLMRFLREGWDSPKDFYHALDIIQTGMSTDQFRDQARSWLSTSLHPDRHVPYTDLIYQPQLELMNYLSENQFQVYVVSASDTDFLRVFGSEAFGFEASAIIGETRVYEFRNDEYEPVLIRNEGTLFGRSETEKPSKIATHIGNSPIFAFGNSTGDIPMLQYTTIGQMNSLGLVLKHDDEAREYEYDTSSAILDEASARGWTVVSMKTDFKTVFPSGTVAVETRDRQGLGIELRDILTIAALLLGPISAAGIALWIEARRRRHIEKEARKLQVLYDLVRARAGFNTKRNRDTLESALNAIPIIFHEDREVRESHSKALTLVGKETFQSALLELIVVVCSHLGFKDVQADTIERIFLFPDEKSS